MTKEEEAELKFLLKEEKRRPLTKDETKTIFNLTRKRIQKIKQKALNRLSKEAEKNKHD